MAKDISGMIARTFRMRPSLIEESNSTSKSFQQNVEKLL